QSLRQHPLRGHGVHGAGRGHRPPRSDGRLGRRDRRRREERMSQNILTALIALVLFLGVLALMAWGWRNRQRSQAHLFDGLPAVPESPGEPVLGPLTGVYVGSTVAGDWQARIVRPPLGHRSGGRSPRTRPACVSSSPTRPCGSHGPIWSTSGARPRSPTRRSPAAAWW